ncbi:MAG TPA: DoxX family protein [Candidatus Manganitrophaceae bacterium]|nr:DoxX family protein [Candidatus Manganitrophaceae bacterium]
MEKRDTLLMKIAPLAGRILIASIFVKAGLSKMIGPEQAQQYMAAYGMSMTRFYLIVTIIVELGGGLALAAGYYTRIVAGALFLFLIPVTLIFHTQFAEPSQVIHFLKNLGLMGGLLYIWAYGPGPISLDEALGGKVNRPVD